MIDWKDEYDAKVESIKQNPKYNITSYEDFIDKYNIYSSFYIEKKNLENTEKDVDTTFNEVQIEYEKKLDDLKLEILNNPSVLDEIDNTYYVTKIKEEAEKAEQEKVEREEIDAISDAQIKYFNFIYNNYASQLEYKEYFKNIDNKFKRIEFDGELKEKIESGPLNEFYQQTLQKGGLQDGEKINAFSKLLSNFFKAEKERLKVEEKERLKAKKELEEQNSIEQDTSRKVNANYAKEKASDKQNFALTRGHIQLTRENSSFTTVQETDTRFISLLGEPASDKEVKLTEKFYDNWLNKPFGAENEIVSLSNKFTRSVLTSEKSSKITSLKLTDTEVIVNDQRLNTDLNLSIGLQKSHLFNFNSHNFKSLKNLIQLYLSESYVEKAGKDLNLPFKNTFIELSDYLFKHFKYLNKLIIEKYTGERIGITRDMWGKGLENAVELLNDQEEINNNIKNSEYKNAADIGLKETFPKKYKGKQSANFITSNSYNRNGLYDKFTRKASYGKRYNGRKTNPVITTFRILIGGPYLLGSMLFDKIGSLFKGKS